MHHSDKGNTYIHLELVLSEIFACKQTETNEFIFVVYFRVNYVAKNSAFYYCAYNNSYYAKLLLFTINNPLWR